MPDRSEALRVDAHVHLSRWWPDVRRTGHRPDLDYSVEGLLGEMDRCGVDQAVAIQLFQAPSELDALAEGREMHTASGGRLVPVATVDPTRGDNSVGRTLEALEGETVLAGVKLFPGYRPFYPNDARLDRVYEFAARRRLPVLLHQGDTLDGLGLLKFARPIEVDELAGRFRDVPFVLCHLGNPWIDEAAELVYKNPNVYTDCSGLLPHPSSSFFDRAFRAAQARLSDALVASGTPDRFLLGSDWPLESLRDAVDLVKGVDLTEQERQGILGGNARRLFRLLPRSPAHRSPGPPPGPRSTRRGGGSPPR